MGFPWFRMSEGQTTAAILAAQRFAEKEAALDALIAAGPGGGVNYIHQTTALLTNAQVLTLADGITVVDPPGANKIILPTYALLVADTLGAAYGTITTADDDIAIKWAGSGPALSYVMSSASFGQVNGFLGFQAISFIALLPQFNYDAAVGGLGTFADTLSLVTNKGLFIVWEAAGNLTGGHANNTLRVTIEYRVYDITTGLFIAA